jgi:hypothetical protein
VDGQLAASQEGLSSIRRGFSLVKSSNPDLGVGQPWSRQCRSYFKPSKSVGSHISAVLNALYNLPVTRILGRADSPLVCEPLSAEQRSKTNGHIKSS